MKLKRSLSIKARLCILWAYIWLNLEINNSKFWIKKPKRKGKVVHTFWLNIKINNSKFDTKWGYYA